MGNSDHGTAYTYTASREDWYGESYTAMVGGGTGVDGGGLQVHPETRTALTGSQGGPRGAGVFLWARYPCKHDVCSRFGDTVGAAGTRVRQAPPPRNGMFLHDKGIKLKLSGDQVYYTACSPLVILKNSCSKVHCHEFLF